MCGIIGYAGKDQAAPILLDGLARLSYRGYDSAGLAVQGRDRLCVAKRAGKVQTLAGALAGAPPPGCAGMGHTRWATHGGVTDQNAHPHLDCSGAIAVVHNGIIENFAALRLELQAQGHSFASETDSEVLPHLIEETLRAGVPLLEAVRRAVGRVQGAAALVALSQHEPGVLVAARISNAGAVVIGYGEGEMLLASDLPALHGRTRRVVFLQDGELAQIDAQGAFYITMAGDALDKTPVTARFAAAVSEKGAHRTFMEKEIFEQPRAVADTINAHLDNDNASFHPESAALAPEALRAVRRVLLLGMGTSLHAALLGRACFERIAGLPAEVDNASEFRYRAPLIDRETLVVAVSQSGETVDTLAAMEEARLRGAPVFTVCNVDGAQSTRVADGVMLTHCGAEVGVASTKTFTAGVAALYMLAVWLGRQCGTLSADAAQRATDELLLLPSLLERVCTQAHRDRATYQRLSYSYGHAQSMLFLGRGLQYPVALEGALKLKEISYVHAEGYAAGELKHGPIALIDAHTPVVALAPRDDLFDKIVSNIQQVQARGGRVLAVGTEGDEELAGLVADTLWTPTAPPLLQALLIGVPLQLFAYEVALRRGADVDQPRNLAKTVTVL